MNGRIHRDKLTPLWYVGILAIVVSATAACSNGDGRSELGEDSRPPSIRLASPAFTDGSTIPARYTCDGEDLSPPLSWSGIPQGTASVALIADDPDAPRGTWVHWVLYAVPPDVTELPEGLPGTGKTPIGARHGTNDFKRLGYGGPCPPRGKAHRYSFKLYALDTEIGLEAGAKKADLLRAMEGHVLGEGRLMGAYQRR